MLRIISRTLSASLLFLGLAALAPGSALADHGHHRRHDRDEQHGRDEHHDRDGRHERDEHRHGSSLFVGFHVSNAACGVPVSSCPEPVRYYDPYCGRGFVSLEIYLAHLRFHRHPECVRVRDWNDPAPRTYRYCGGGWVRCGD